MLKNIPEIISPDLMKALMEMGHSDTIVIADGNFPAHTKNVPVIRMDGHGVSEILEAILKFFPLDTYAKKSVKLMETVKEDVTVPKIWNEYKMIIEKNNYDSKKIVGNIERFSFYEESKNAYVIVATSEKSLYANIILQKGVI